MLFSAGGTTSTSSMNLLLKLNPMTGAGTPFGDILSYNSSGDLAFDADGHLYLSAQTGSSAGRLLRIDPDTGDWNHIGLIGFNDVYGLAFGPNGVMYGASNSARKVFTIDLATGAGTEVADFAGSDLDGAYGSSFFGEAEPRKPGGGSSTTTTTLPGATAEVCGNCRDDDGDGRTDFEDPRCCGSTASIVLRRGSLRANNGRGRLNLESQVSGAGLGGVNPLAQDLHLQIRVDGGAEIFCGRVPASGFKKRGKVFQFRDKKAKVPGTGGVDGAVVRLLRTGRLQLHAEGKRATLANPVPGALVLTAAFRDPSTAEQGNRCASVTKAFRQVGRNKDVRFP
jgi:hypothetical protein